MKILVATEETQGRKPNDFFWAREGELVAFGSECRDEPIDGTCGCRRALCGVVTRLATTTFRVEEREELSPEDLVDVLATMLVAGRWFATVEQALPAAGQNAARLARLAASFADGTILSGGATTSSRASRRSSPPSAGCITPRWTSGPTDPPGARPRSRQG